MSQLQPGSDVMEVAPPGLPQKYGSAVKLPLEMFDGFISVGMLMPLMVSMS